MKTLLAFGMALVGTVAAIAQPQQDPITAPLVTQGGPPVVATQMSGGIEYLNGGSDIDTANYLKSRGSEYPLQFTITGKGGQWAVADQLTLRDSRGTEVSIPQAGPYVLVKLPPGTYTAEASFNGQTERRTISVGNGVSRVSWNTQKVAG